MEEFRRSELSKKYIAKILFGWDDKKFENEYLKKSEGNWEIWKRKDKMIWEAEVSSSRVGILKGR